MKSSRRFEPSARTANAIAIASLFVALGTGAYAAGIAANSVGSQQIKPSAVGESELKDDAVTAEKVAQQAIGQKQLKKKAVGEEQLAEQAVGKSKLKDAAVGEAALEAGAVSKQKLKDAAVGEAQLEAGAVSKQKLKDAAVGLQQLQDEAVSKAKLQLGAVAAALADENSVGTLYTDNDETGFSITTDTQIASLSLPAGSYMVFGSVEAVHTAAAAHTRLECYTTGDAGLVDFAKERLQPNVNATDSLIFTKQTLMGPATLGSNGTINYRCTTTGAASTIALGPIHFQALRLAKVVAQ